MYPLMGKVFSLARDKAKELGGFNLEEVKQANAYYDALERLYLAVGVAYDSLQSKATQWTGEDLTPIQGILTAYHEVGQTVPKSLK